MIRVVEPAGEDVLVAWASRLQAPTRPPGRTLGLRFAFYAMHAKWGRRLQRYDPDPSTAATVRWIFAERLRGRSMAGIAAALNERGVPCPSQADRDRNPHRAGLGWGSAIVRAILGNAKYTGRQVWNRQPAQYTPPHLPGPFRTQEWAGADEWVISAKPARPALVSEADFVAVQELRAAAARHGEVHRYWLVGLLRCGRCGRALDSCWSHNRPAYRCRHGQTSARPRQGRLKNLYVREDRILAVVRGLLAEVDEEATAAQVADRLRGRGFVVSCAETVCSLERV